MNYQIYRIVFLVLFFVARDCFGGDNNRPANNGRFLLQMAIDKNDLSQVQRLLQQGIDPNSLDYHGSTALIQAAEHDSSGIVDCLLDFGVDPNIPGDFGNTALMQASARGNLGMVQALIKHNANIDAQDRKFKNTPLMRAVLGRHEKVVCFLVEAGAKLNLLNNQGKDVVYIAEQRANESLAQFYFKKTAIELAVQDHGKSIGIVKIIKLGSFFKKIHVMNKRYKDQPKPDDYIDDISLPIGKSVEKIEDLFNDATLKLQEKQVEAFQDAYEMYWQIELQKAYLQYLEGDKTPLIEELLLDHCNLLPVFASCFKSREAFVEFLEMVAKDSELSPEVAGQIVKMLDVEKDACRTVKAVSLLQAVWKKCLAEKFETKGGSQDKQIVLSAKKIQSAWAIYKKKK